MASHGRAHLRALFEVFVRPSIVTTVARPAIISPPPRLHPRAFTTAPVRLFSHTLLRLRGPTKRTVKPKAAPKTLYDDSIPARQVRVVDPTTNDLGPVTSRRQALWNIDASKNRLMCVSKVPRYIGPSDPEYDEIASNYDYIVEQYRAQQKRFGQGEVKDELSVLEDGEEEAEVEEEDIAAVRRAPAIYIPRGGYVRLPSGEDWIPVCKVENKAEAAAKVRAAEQAKKEQKKLAPEGVKIIELNWAIADGDLGHRLKKVEEFLNARRRVEVVIAPKRRGKKATREEAERVLRTVKDAVGKVDGAKETRPMQGQVGGVVSLMLEGKRGKHAAQTA
ncbi:Hypothetical protein D9617_16g014030 [Elsinoe fawcettii]|nr:Hypothetical protein D9617_16g014030 [Elsinoe fawcettii]